MTVKVVAKISDQGSGEKLDADVYVLSESSTISQLASLALEQSGLKAKGYRWNQVRCDDPLNDVDFDDPVQEGCIYHILAVQKQAKQNFGNSQTGKLQQQSQPPPALENMDVDEELSLLMARQADLLGMQPPKTSMAAEPIPKPTASGNGNFGTFGFGVHYQQLQPFVASNIEGIGMASKPQQQLDSWMPEPEPVQDCAASQQQQRMDDIDFLFVDNSPTPSLRGQPQQQPHQLPPAAVSGYGIGGGGALRPQPSHFQLLQQQLSREQKRFAGAAIGGLGPLPSSPTKRTSMSAPQPPQPPQFLLNLAPGSIQFSKRRALGSVFSVGDFYNANIDSLVEQSDNEGDKKQKQALNEKLRALKAFKFEPAKVSNSNCTIGNKPADLDCRFAQLGVGAEQKASIIVGLTTVKGYGDFLNMGPEQQMAMDDDKHGADSCQFTLFQSVGTKKVGAKLSDPEVAQMLLNPARLGHFKGATHFIQTVYYGCAVVCVFKLLQPETDEAKQNVDIERVKQIILKFVKDNYDKKTDLDYLKSVQAHFSVQMFTNEETLAVLDWKPEQGCFALLKKLQTCKLRAQLEMDKRTGTSSPLEHPISFDLLPLEQLVQPAYLEAIGINAINRSGTELIDNQMTIHECVKQWQAASQQHHRIRKMFQQLICQFDYCLPERIFKQLSDLTTQLGTQYDELASSCRQLVKDIRCGKEGEQRRLESTQFGSKIQTFMDVIRALETSIREQDWRLEGAKWLKRNGVPYVGRSNATLAKEMEAISNASNSPAHCFVLFCPENNGGPAVADHYQLFGKLVTAGEKCIFVDVDLAGEQEVFEQIPPGLRLVKFKDGHPQNVDYFGEYVRKQYTCIAQLDSGATKTSASEGALPPTLIALEIPCPNFFQSKCPNEDYFWECDDCGHIVQFDKNTDLVNAKLANQESLGYFYCGCGRSPASKFKFRCKNAHLHGEDFTTYPFFTLVSQLKQMCPQEDSTHLLILSETGCGKSTMINAIPNYLTFQSLEDAIDNWKNKGPVYLIPANFMKGTKEIKIGEMDDKRLAGDSDTQETKCHVIPFKGQQFKIFDTPGVCDTAGLDKDELNFKNIMWSISSYKHLNGILILVKPNSARLTVAFKYCINELLKHLHKDAARNIVFCFTNSSGTNYEEGDTIPALRRLLKEIEEEHGVHIEMNEDTCYYLDNEAFRHLCLVHNGIEPTEMAQRRAAESWDRSAPEIRRLFSYMQDLPPHNVESTVSLNEARRIIITLAQPLALTTKTIQENIALAEAERDRIAKLDANTADLKKDVLSHPQRYVAKAELPHPRTVCTAPSCTTVSIDEYGQSTTVYSTHCHPHCYLTGVRKEAIADPALQGCAAMFDDNGQIKCKVCPPNCGWEQHMHIYYELMDCTKMVENPTVADMIKQNTDSKLVIEQALADMEEGMAQNKLEQDTINEIAARFGTYLKRNSIVAHNKYIDDYINMQIDNARVEAQYTKNDSKVKALEKALNEYWEQRKIIERYLDTGKETIRPEDISKYLKELFALKLNGMQIRALFKAEEDSMNKRAACAELPYVNKIGVRAHSNAPDTSRFSTSGLGSNFSHTSLSYASVTASHTGGSQQSGSQESTGKKDKDCILM